MRLFSPIFLCLVVCAAADAQNYRFFDAVLNGAQENPPVPTLGTGTGSAVYDPDTDLLTVSMSYSGLTQPATLAHIHCCATALDQNAGVAIDFTGANGFVPGSTSGTYNHVFDLSQNSSYTAGYLSGSGGTAAQARDRLLNAMRVGVANDPLPGNTEIAYFNIHTNFRPGGEIRGNIVPNIPEPAAILLLIGGLVPLALRRGGR
jgi:hypothetical protein